MGEIEDLMTAMGAAVPTGRSAYVEEGVHILKLKLAKGQRTSYDGKSKESYVFEFEVLQSSNPSHEVGSTRGYVENMNNDGALGRIKACLIALCGIPSSHKLTPDDENKIKYMIAAIRYDDFRARLGWPENFLKDRVVFCEGSEGKSKKGTDITHKKWEPYTPPAAS